MVYLTYYYSSALPFKTLALFSTHLKFKDTVRHSQNKLLDPTNSHNSNSNNRNKNNSNNDNR